MPQERDPILCMVKDGLHAAPRNVLATPKAAQPTRPGRPTQTVVYVDEVATMNEDHNAGVVDIGVMVGNIIYWFDTYAMATAGYWYRRHVHWTILSDYQVVARFHLVAEGDGNYVGDVCHLNCNGYHLEEYTSP